MINAQAKQIVETFGNLGLPNMVEVFIPSTYSVERTDGNNYAPTFVRIVAHRMAELFGGATIIPAQGAYLAENGDLVFENITIVQGMASDKALDNTALAEIAYHAAMIRRVMKQESVAVKVNGVMHFIEK